MPTINNVPVMPMVAGMARSFRRLIVGGNKFVNRDSGLFDGASENANGKFSPWLTVPTSGHSAT